MTRVSRVRFMALPYLNSIGRAQFPGRRGSSSVDRARSTGSPRRPFAAAFAARRVGLTFAVQLLDVIPRLSPLHRLGLTLAGAALLALGATSSATSCAGNQ